MDDLLRRGFAQVPRPEPRPGFEARVSRRLTAQESARAQRWLRTWPVAAAIASAAVLVLFVAPVVSVEMQLLLVPASFAATLGAPELLRRLT